VKLTIRCVLLAIFFVLTPTIAISRENSFVSMGPEPEYYAWWLRTEFHPFGAEVRGIPVHKIHANWCKATEFRKDLFPPKLALDLNDTGTFTFAKDGIFDGSTTKQTALLGVYETCTGEQGTFLLILSWPKSDKPKIRFVHEMSLEHQFSMLSVSADATITVQHCLDCDHTTEFRWSKLRGRFVRLAANSME
jgi:hypothetical protein